MMDHNWMNRNPPSQRYIVRTHASPALTRFQEWYSENRERYTAGSANDGPEIHDTDRPLASQTGSE